MDKIVDASFPISVIMPVKDGAKYLLKAVDSILRQSFVQFEFLILNNGSVDETSEILSKITDERIIVINNPRGMSLVSCLNNAMTLARGKYIARMDADDISMPTRLEKQYFLLENNPSIVLCGAWFEIFGTRSEIIRHPVTPREIKAAMLTHNPVCHPLVMFKKDVIIENEFYFLEDYPACEDYQLWATLSLKYDLYNIPEVLLKYRQHDSQISTQKTILQWNNSARVRKQLFDNLGLKNFKCENYEHTLKHRFDDISNYDEVLDLLENVILQNRTKKIYDESTLISTFYPYWKQLIFYYPKPSLELYHYFEESIFNKNFPLKLIKRLKFYFKCLKKNYN